MNCDDKFQLNLCEVNICTRNTYSYAVILCGKKQFFQICYVVSMNNLYYIFIDTEREGQLETSKI